MINTQTQIDSLIDLAVIQRTELKQLIESLPQLRDHLSSEIERNLEEIEPAIRSELEQFVAARALDTQAKTSAELSAKLDAMARNLESTTAAKYSVLMAERAENANLLAKAEARIEDAASMLSHAVKEIVTDELSRFPRAGEIDQLRKEFAEPRGLNPRGRWQVGETYNKLDLVSYNGDSYVSSTDGNREKPSRSSEAWTLSAARGNGGGGGVTSMTDLVPVPSNGQLLIGNGSAFVNATLTAGTGISISNGPGSITINATDGNITLDDGTAAAPSLNFTSDTNTGLYRPAADTVGIVGGGHDIVRLTDVASATDYLEIKNAIGVATPLHVLASGPSTNIGLHLQPKGSGLITISDGTDFNKGIRFRSSSSATSAITLLDAVSTAGRVITLPDATDTLVGKATTDTLTNKTLTTPTIDTITAPATTNLTLAGGSTGASLVLGQGASAASSTITNTGTGSLSVVNGDYFNVLTLSRNSLATNTGTTMVFRSKDAGGTYVDVGAFFAAKSVATIGAVDSFLTWSTRRAGTLTDAMTLASTGNLLIGGTTDIPGSGGLKVFGTTAASSTASGALQVAGGVGVAGAGHFGGNLSVGPTSATAYAGYGVVAISNATNGGVLDFLIGSTVYGEIVGNSSGLGFISAQTGTAISFGVNGISDVFKLSGTTLANGKAAITYNSASTGVGTGALQVAGGIYAGAASVFGGDVTLPSSIVYTNRVYNYTGGATPLILGWTGSAAVLSLFSSGAATFAGAVLNSDGTAAAPSLSFSADTDTGFYRQNTNVIGVSLAGAAAGRFEGDGASGIRFRHPTGNYLGLNNSGAIEVIAAGTNQNITLTPSGTGAVTVNSKIIGVQAGAAATAIEGARLTNTTTTGSVYLNFNETNSTATPAYLIRYGSTHASSANILELAATGTGAKFRVLPAMSISDTTAGSAGAGALVVSGGLATGAASYFGGDVTRSGSGDSIIKSVTTSGTSHGKFNTVADVAQATLRTEGSATSGTLFSTNRASATQLYSESGPLVLGAFGAHSTVIGTNNAARLTIDSAGAATFAGAVAIGNTVNTVSPTSPNRTVTMVIGGVTYYLAAKTTND